MKYGRNMGQGRRHSAERNRPKFTFKSKGHFPGGLTQEEVESFLDGIASIRAARLYSDLFQPEARRG